MEYTSKIGEKAENVCIWYLKDDGSYERISCKYADGYATFTTSHLSDYAVMVEEPAPMPSESGSDNTALIIDAVVGVIAIIAVIAFFVIKGKH